MVIEGAPTGEKVCFAVERRLNLHRVEFTTFQSAIKRFGYKVELNKNHLLAIAPQIKLDVNKMQEDKDSIYSIVYLDEEFAHQNDKFCVDKLILIGWLLCFHWSKEIQINELWDIINPDFAAEVDKDVVVAFLEDLIYIAVSLCYKIVSVLPKTQEKEQATAYLDRCQENYQIWKERAIKDIPEKVSKDEFERHVDPFTRTYDIRIRLEDLKSHALEKQ